MNKKVRINVTAKDIKLGEAAHAQHCPIARAITRKLKPTYWVSVFTYITIYAASGPEGLYRVDNPAAEWMFNFDSGELVKPITFSIELPEEALA